MSILTQLQAANSAPADPAAVPHDFALLFGLVPPLARPKRAKVRAHLLDVPDDAVAAQAIKTPKARPTVAAQKDSIMTALDAAEYPLRRCEVSERTGIPPERVGDLLQLLRIAGRAKSTGRGEGCLWSPIKT
ncbi:hypothetical protein [Pseudothauera rhizosphaerae]|uniref:DprA winged helix domain-containing protein n=1 Tax=Pseudothauera rhizosphaerae TaxID=2565932 RepID=A0A4S4AFS6_9RHOO|nr:hypothetical protein [Pseudothauera rhizosphaerae]THF58046.1 hypothetical protein E6O51_17035 [Pseudothauera rhizosphaerae]